MARASAPPPEPAIGAGSGGAIAKQGKLTMSELFNQFHGADLDRLAECIKAIRKAGLQTSKHTQAGVNQSSGNVWVWDEDWQGCVACSIGFNVFWHHSCPKCGEEYEFDTYRELQDYVATHEHQCEACGNVNAEA